MAKMQNHFENVNSTPGGEDKNYHVTKSRITKRQELAKWLVDENTALKNPITAFHIYLALGAYVEVVDFSKVQASSDITDSIRYIEQLRTYFLDIYLAYLKFSELPDRDEKTEKLIRNTEGVCNPFDSFCYFETLEFFQTNVDYNLFSECYLLDQHIRHFSRLRTYFLRLNRFHYDSDMVQRYVAEYLVEEKK